MTGGAGFIGSHIVDALINLGHKVIVIDNESSQVHDQFYYNDKAKYYKYNITDYKRTNRLYKDVDCVFHCAAQSRIMTAFNNPIEAIDSNVVGTTTVLQCSKENDVRRVVYSSTSSAYGLTNPVPSTEDMRPDCLNPYSVSKIAGEEICKIYSSLYNLSTVVFRYFNVYGPREPIKGPYAPLIGLFLRQFRANEALTIVPDGHQRRDFIHVDDVVNANLMACFSDTVYHTLLNVGTAKSYSVKEIARMISINTKFIDERPGEARETLADISKIKKELNWSPNKDLKDYIQYELGSISH